MNDKNQEVIDFLKTLKSHYSANFKKFRPDLYEFILEYTKFLDCQNPTFCGRLSCVVKRQHELLHCLNENCNNILDIHNCRPFAAFPRFCSLKCLHSSAMIKEQKKQTMLKHFGVEHPGQLEYVREAGRQYLATHKDEVVAKREKTNIETYGCVCPLQNPIVHAKSVATIIEHFGVDNVFKSPIIKEQVKQTLIDEYGVDNAFKSDEVKEKIKQTNLKNFGCEYATQNAEIIEKQQKTSRQTCMEKYDNPTYFGSETCKQYCMKHFGCENPMQNAEIRKKQQQKYEYEMIHFDSAPEIAYYIWLTDHNIQFEYQPDVHFNYEADNKKHSYFPDFIVEGQLVELKGSHFFNDDGTMCNPYDHSQDELYEAKHQCMIKNKVNIITDSSLCVKVVYDYIDKKYGEGYLQQFKNCNQKSK